MDPAKARSSVTLTEATALVGCWPTVACRTIWSAYDEQASLTRALQSIKRIDQSVKAVWSVNTLANSETMMICRRLLDGPRQFRPLLLLLLMLMMMIIMTCEGISFHFISFCIRHQGPQKHTENTAMTQTHTYTTELSKRMV